MRAIHLTGPNEITVADIPNPEPASGEAVVRLHAAALNHRDLWIKLGQYAGIAWPVLPGSDGAGVIEAIKGDGQGCAVGDEVIINPSFGWGEGTAAQGPEFGILGLPRAGTFAERVAVPVGQLSPKPLHLGWAEAAALPLAGLTAYRALFSRAHLHGDDRVLINGIGGGVALFALQYAVAAGAEVWVTSSSSEKIERAVKLGAKGGFDYRQPDWATQATRQTGGFDVVVDSAGGDGFEALVDACQPGARIVFFGATRGNPGVLPMRKVFWRQLSLLGTTMGSPDDWAAMVNFVTECQIQPVVSATFELDEAGAAFDLMERGGQFGKIVLKTA